MLAASLILTILLRIFLLRENHRRTNLSLAEYQHEAATNEPCDRVSLYTIFFASKIVLSFCLAS